MPVKIFINNLDTFVSRQVLAELRGDNVVRNEEDEGAGEDEEKPLFYGTYFDKDSSEKLFGTAKMLKVGAHCCPHINFVTTVFIAF